MTSETNDIEKSQAVALLSELIDDPAFQSLLRHFSRSCITWEYFLEQPLPKGASPIQVWDLLCKLSRIMGVSLAVPDITGVWYHYRRSHDLTDAVSIVSQACSSGSHLYKTMTEVSKKHFLLDIKVSDMIAAARMDGFVINERDAFAILSLEKAPRNATEQLVVNTFEATDHLPELVDEPFSKELILYLCEMLLKDVNLDEIESISNPPLGLSYHDFSEEVSAAHSDSQMESISSWANHETGDPYDHKAIRAMLLFECFRSYRPIRKASSQVGRLVTHLYGMKNDLPMLGLLPSFRARLDWYEGRIQPPDVDFTRAELDQIKAKSPDNLTCLATVAAQLMLLSLREVERDVILLEQRNKELEKMLIADPGLNARQRNVLGRALKDPGAEFTIRYHKTENDISYPTARGDFLELVEKGYLRMSKRSRSFIFSASPNLQELFGIENLDTL